MNKRLDYQIERLEYEIHEFIKEFSYEINLAMKDVGADKKDFIEILNIIETLADMYHITIHNTLLSNELILEFL